MAVCSLPSLPFSLHPSLSFPKISPPHLNSNPQQNPSRRNLSLACSAEKSSKKGKPSRARMTDDELCKELREVMAAAGILDHRVPTLKELSENGRKDLANIVRHRGYKVILELLRQSFEKDSSTEKNPLGNQDTSNACRDEASEDQERNLNKSAGCFSTSNSSSENDFVVRQRKEMELSLLKQQIEMEKQALSDLQAKANVESSNAQRIITELNAAEESLLGLKEVQIEYRANGECVEIAGSFNGWDHQIKMDPHPSSNTINPPESRKSKLWSMVLWLYPGMYEVYLPGLSNKENETELPRHTRIRFSRC